MSNINYYDTTIKDRESQMKRPVRVVMGDFDLSKFNGVNKDIFNNWNKYIYFLDSGHIIAAHEKDDSYSVLTQHILKSNAKKLMDDLNTYERREEKLKDILGDEEIQ